MKIDILTLFPEMFEGPFSESMIKRAQQNNLVEINIHNVRKFTTDKHKTVDDKQYGGGAGMVMMVEPIDNAIQALKFNGKNSQISKQTMVILLTPQGSKHTQKKAQELSLQKHIILIAGHYEGFDERIKNLVDEEISIGDFVLTGGELPAMVLTDSITRLIPGVLGDSESLDGETHAQEGHVKHPVYTRPENYKGWKVPEILLSGNHKEIQRWRQENNR